ncbi:uncharacterized protein METZ01_LOCUS213815, partial [marine metagenome]
MAISGINHLAFITHDLEATIRFYRDLLGMTLESPQNVIGPPAA